MNSTEFKYRPLWNLLLIVSGAVLFSFGIKAVVIEQQFITGGLYGIGLLIYYSTQAFSPEFWYLLLNIPLFAVSWFFVSRRFFLYSLCAALLITLSSYLIHYDLKIHDQFYAAIAAGFLCGAGSGLILRSLGSGGGLDVVAVILNQKFNIGIGRLYLIFNSILFVFFLIRFDIDLVIASLIVVFISSISIDYLLAMFSQRKIVMIISHKNQEIAGIILENLKQGATFIKARGAYRKQDREILMAITNNIMLKRMEEAVFTIDPDALFIVENTFNVLGSTFGRRKIY